MAYEVNVNGQVQWPMRECKWTGPVAYEVSVNGQVQWPMS